MGVKDLAKVIGDHSPASVKVSDIKSYFGRKVAVDASMCLYQFLIAIRQDGNQLQSESGDTTSHLNGMFYRTIRMIDNGIKPVYVFDGKPPTMKANELTKRLERRSEAAKQLEDAVELGDEVTVNKFERRLVKVTKEQNDEAKRLITLMGVPVIDAPCEAEAQCAALAKAGKVYATATEDMDALTFGSPRLLRQMLVSEAKKLPVKEINLERILKDFNFDMDQFVDLCILLGCDYAPTIRGIGPKKAFELIQKHRTIENILEALDEKKYPAPDNWLFKEARHLFKKPDVLDSSDIKLVWKDPDVEGIVQFLCVEKSFNEDRVRASLARMQKGRQAAQQGRIDSFFAVSTITKSETTSQKRNSEDNKVLRKRPPAKKVKK